MGPKRPPRRRGRRGGARRRGRKPIGDLAAATPPALAPEAAPTRADEQQPFPEQQTFAEAPPAPADAGLGGEGGSEPGPEARLEAHGIEDDFEPVNLQEPEEAGPAVEPERVVPAPGRDRPAAAPPLPPPAAPSGRRKSPIDEAIAHAEQIAGNLRAALEDMEEILELLEIAQVQKIGDEREITDLRRALQRLQRHDLSGPPMSGHGRGHGFGDRHPPGRSGPPAQPAG